MTRRSLGLDEMPPGYMAGRWMALPVKHWGRPAGWRVLQCPIGPASRCAGTYRGPFARPLARRKALRLNRKQD